MYVVSLERNCLRLLKTGSNNEEVVIKAQSIITDYSLQQHVTDRDDWVLYCLEDTGSVYCVKSQQVQNQLGKPTQNPVNEDIFSDLLGSNEDGVWNTEFMESTVPVYRLQACHLLYTVAGKPHGICSHNDILIAIATIGQQYVFTALRVFYDGIQSVIKGEVGSTVFDATMKEIIDGRRYASASTLMKIITSDLIEEECTTTTTDSLEMENNLFKCLFGSTTALLNSPVLLFCPPEGSVYSIPVHSLFKHLDNKPTLLETEDAQDRKASWKVLCGTASCVVNILTLKVPYQNPTDDQYSNIEEDIHLLLMCCQNGSLITYHYESSNRKQEIVSQLTTTGQVIGSDTFCNRLYHSTLSNLYETSLVIVKDGRKSGLLSDESVKVKSVKTCRQAMISGINVEAVDMFTDTRDAPCLLHCMQQDGTLRTLDSGLIFNNNSPDTPFGNMNIKNVLVAIDKTDKEQQKLSEDIKHCDKWLEQMSIVSFLLSSHFKIKGANISNNRKDDKLPIGCKCTAVMRNYARQEGQGHIDLHCAITNQMPRNLSGDWCLEITILPTNFNNFPSKPDISAIVHPLNNGLKTMETVNVVMAIQLDLIPNGFDVIVTLNLDISYCLNSDDKNTCLSIPAFREKMDILHFLVSKQEYLTNSRYIETTVPERILSLALQRPSANVLVQDSDKCEVKSPSVSITKSLRFLTGQDQLIPSHGQVLKYILKDSNLPPDDTEKDKCHVMTMTGHDLYLEVKEGQIHLQEDMHANCTGEVTKAALTIQSDLPTLSAVSMAIDKRQQVLQMTQSSCPASVGVLKKLDRKLQNIEMDIQALVSNKALTDKEMDSQIANLYQRLRSLINTE